MDSLPYKTCPGNGTSSTRYFGCRGITSVSQDPVSSSGMSSQDRDSSIPSGKGLRHIGRKISSNVFPKASVSFNISSARISDTPPGGKRALLCGISYKNKKFRLRGTTQDVMSVGDLLIQKFDFPADSILILAEDGPYEPPTKSNILRAFQWLMKGIKAGDSLVFYYSGHGLRQLEFNGDEADGFDEAICPLDFETEGLILDNEINEIIVRPLKQGVMLHAIIDSCHSGTVLDLHYIYDCDEERWKGNHLPSTSFKGTSGGQAICFSACEDHQQAADTSAFSPERTMAGAMTHNFRKAILDNPGITYLGILEYMAKAIEDANVKLQRRCVGGRILGCFHRRMLQDPLLSASEVFDVNLVFKL